MSTGSRLSPRARPPHSASSTPDRRPRYLPYVLSGHPLLSTENTAEAATPLVPCRRCTTFSTHLRGARLSCPPSMPSA